MPTNDICLLSTEENHFLAHVFLILSRTVISSPMLLNTVMLYHPQMVPPVDVPL